MQAQSKTRGRPGEGIEVRHRRDCPKARGGRRCSCEPSYRAEVYDRATRRKLRRTFPTLAAARAWRADAAREVKARRRSGDRAPTFRQAAAAFMVAARDGSALTRSGDRYKPSAIRGYEQAARLRLTPALGPLRLDEIERGHLQRLVERMLLDGAKPSTVRNTINAARAVYRRSLLLGEVATNPTEGLRLPAVRGRRERIASVAEAAALLDALPEASRPVWATFFYAGLRVGEARALTCDDLDLPGGLIRVRATWDRYEREQLPKSEAARRDVPIPETLARYLREHLLRTGRRRGLLFGRTEHEPFSDYLVYKGARRAWARAGHDRIIPHEARHTYASLMIEAAARSGENVNVKALSEYMGHSSIAITYDRYGHLLPGDQAQAARRLDALLAPAASE